MKHELTITHDKLIGARPFCISCLCGFKGAAESYAEAVRICETHREWEIQKDRAREKGLLK